MQDLFASYSPNGQLNAEFSAPDPGKSGIQTAGLTAGRLPKATDSTTLADSLVTEATAAVEFNKVQRTAVGVTIGLEENTYVLDFSTDLITGNIFDCKVNGVSIAPVTFTTTHANTMILIRTAIIALAPTATGVISGDQLVMTPGTGQSCILTSAAVTGGASQPDVFVQNVNNSNITIGNTNTGVRTNNNDIFVVTFTGSAMAGGNTFTCLINGAAVSGLPYTYASSEAASLTAIAALMQTAMGAGYYCIADTTARTLTTFPVAGGRAVVSGAAVGGGWTATVTTTNPISRTLSLMANGDGSADIRTNGEFIRGRKVGGLWQALFRNGSTTIPALGFQNDPTTGLFLSANGTIGIINGGTQAWRITSVRMGASVTSAARPELLNNAASATTAVFTFTNDEDTGFGEIGANNPNVVAGGRTAVGFQSSGDATSTDYISLESRGAGIGYTELKAYSIGSGADSDVDILLTPKGNGLVRFGAYTVGILNVATGKIPIKAANGTTYYIPVTATAG